MLSKYKSGKYMFNILFILMIILITGSIVIAGGNDSHFVTISYFDDAMVFEGGVETNWSLSENEEALSGAEKMSMHSNHSVEFTFTGTKFRWIGSKAPGRGKADIYHNGELLASGVDLYSETTQNQAIIFSKEFDKGTHTIRIEPTGEKREEAIMALVSVDAFQYVPTLEVMVEQIKEMIYTAPGVPEVGVILEDFYQKEDKDALIKALAKGIFVFKKSEPSQEEIYDAIAHMITAKETFEQKALSPVFSDISNNNNNATPSPQNIRWVEGKFNKAVYLDGNQTYLELRPGLLEGEKKITVEAWIKPESDGNDRRLVACDDGNAWHLNQAQGRVANDAGQWQSWARGESPELNVWTHAALVYDGQYTIYYQNGEEVAREEVGEFTINEPGDRSVIGANIQGGSIGGSEFHGTIDEVRLWNIARSEDEIAENMNQELTGDEEGLVAYLNFNEVVGVEK